MAKRKGSLLRQLTISLGLAIIFLSLASFYYQFEVEKHILTANIRGDLRQQANLVRAWLADAPDKETCEKTARQYIETMEHLDKTKQEIVIVDERSRVIAANTGGKPGREYASEMLRQAMAPGASRDGVCMQVANDFTIALPFYADPGGKKVKGAILLKQPLTEVGSLASSLMLGAFILLALTLIIIVAVVHVVLRLKVHRPMQAIFMQEYRIREGDLARIDAEDPANEFSDLYAMYNEMVVRIAEQKRAIIEQKDHVALAHMVRQAIARLTGPLDEILSKSRTLLEHQSSLAPADRTTLKEIIANITLMTRELKGIIVEGNESATWLRHESEKVREHTDKPGDQTARDRRAIE